MGQAPGPRADFARRAIAVDGVVQGVGFRPFVYGVASRLGLCGFVTNQTGGVLIEVEGAPEALDRFVTEISSCPPPLARIDRLRAFAQPPRGDTAFRIEASRSGRPASIVIAPDVATCEACLRELFDPAERRYRYPFVNCTACGPRLTIITATPYDREHTTMAGFAMCPACRAEYEDPDDRRFHAQPIACPACGPRLRALDARGMPVGTDDPLGHCVSAIRAGLIAAVKGIGGYHLACDARSEAAVAELRRRKQRDEKPFAVMVAHLDAARVLAVLSADERCTLGSPARPIVLLQRRAGAALAEAVAPGTTLIGLMLPYTPMHHLLLRDLGGPVVMTSGNRSDEPVACEDADALERLAGIADLFLVHDRPIQLRCEDSVVRVVAQTPVPIRRSRGYAPQSLTLPLPLAQSTLALGGHLKATFALGEGHRVVVSPHLGDLDGYEAYAAYGAAIDHYERLFRVQPRRAVHDLHPDYASTRYALERAQRDGLDLVAVQHHHAHMASCMAEQGLQERAIGICFDGAGAGLDGAVWGGEFLVGDAADVRRAAHLRYVGMPGGERAIREPWRMALAYLVDAGEDVRDSPVGRRIGAGAARTIERMLERRFNAPPTSSVGRLFDAIAALAGVCDRVSFEAQAAVRLEALAAGIVAVGAYPFEIAGSDAVPPDAAPLVVDARPLVREVARETRRGVAPAVIARRLHTTVVEIIASVCGRVRERTGIETVVLSGGVFVNAILAGEATSRLAAIGFRVYRHRAVPPNDGGLCLGQLAIAAARDQAAAAVKSV
jgi:hydrogenase maturation protein HypF